MSRNSAAIFLMQIRKDEELQAELGTNPSLKNFVEKAQRLGLSFTPEELSGVGEAEQFYQTASEDAALFKRVRGCSSDAEVLEIVRELGFGCGIEDLEAVLSSARHFTAANDGELSDSELESVAGGMFPGTASKVPSPPAPFAPVPYPNMGPGSSNGPSKSFKARPSLKGRGF